MIDTIAHLFSFGLFDVDDETKLNMFIRWHYGCKSCILGRSFDPESHVE
ncbi:hypothetical protein JCM19239_3269 [Vibrio variabilis]|uniref:Uncharacterized protein n=1 Tax=Vibrio variabilis TaxID=990271 RepID=A0ABQ0JH95_9VIBR|nr:hypothetical protein JCM19239_3269 [Vibrio variabilis]